MPTCTIEVGGYATSRLKSFCVSGGGGCSVVFLCLSQMSGHGSSTNQQEFFASPDDFRSHELGLVLPDRDPEVVGFSVFSAGLVYE